MNILRCSVEFVSFLVSILLFSGFAFGQEEPESIWSKVPIRKGAKIWEIVKGKYGHQVVIKGGVSGISIFIPKNEWNESKETLTGIVVKVEDADSIERFREGLLGAKIGLFGASTGMAAGCLYVARLDFRLADGKEFSIWAQEYPLGFTTIEWARPDSTFQSPELHLALQEALRAHKSERSGLVRNALFFLKKDKPKPKHEGTPMTKEHRDQVLRALKEDERRHRMEKGKR